MKKQYLVITLALGLLLASPLTTQIVQAQQKNLPAEQEIELQYGADRLGKRHDSAMQKFRENRLGAFIHWGLYAIPGGEWNGKSYHGAAEWLKAWAKVPTTDWLKLMNQWDPQQFDAKKWAKMAKNMGVKYVKITTKHHEGFCLWPSKYTEYTVANTSYKKDILGELVKAYNAVGIDVHFCVRLESSGLAKQHQDSGRQSRFQKIPNLHRQPAQRTGNTLSYR